MNPRLLYIVVSNSAQESLFLVHCTESRRTPAPLFLLRRQHFLSRAQQRNNNHSSHLHPTNPRVFQVTTNRADSQSEANSLSWEPLRPSWRSPSPTSAATASTIQLSRSLSSSATRRRPRRPRNGVMLRRNVFGVPGIPSALGL